MDWTQYAKFFGLFFRPYYMQAVATIGFSSGTFPKLRQVGVAMPLFIFS